MKKLLLLIFLFEMQIYANLNKKDGITIKKALSIAIKNSPKIEAIKKEIIIKKLSGKSKSLYPNPEIGIEVSDFLGTKNYSGFKNSEFSLNLSQEIILAGKNSKLIKLTNGEVKVIELEINKEKNNLKYNIRKLFTEILILKEFNKLSLKNQKISLEILNTVKGKRESGAISNLEVLKSEIEYKNSEIALKKENEAIETVKNLLSKLIGQKIDSEIIGKLELTENSSLFYQNTLDSSIKIKIKKVIINNKERLLSLEKSNKIPNLTINLGANRYQKRGEYSFTMGVSIPIPLWNTNSVRIKSVYNEIEKNKKELEAIKKEISEKLLKNIQKLKLAKIELVSLKKSVLPLAKKSLALAKEGYKEGQFKYLELLDAKKTFIMIKKRYIEVLSRYNFLVLKIEYLLGE